MSNMLGEVGVLDLDKATRKLLKSPNTPMSAIREALRFYNAALELPNPSMDPAERAQILVNRAAAFIRLDECRQAMGDIDRALQLDPASPRIHAYKGELLLKLRQYKAASEVFLAGLNIDASSGRLERGFKASLARMRETGCQYCPQFVDKQHSMKIDSEPSAAFDPHSALTDEGIQRVLQRNRVVIVGALKGVLEDEAAFWETEGLPPRFWDKAGKKSKKKTLNALQSSTKQQQDQRALSQDPEQKQQLQQLQQQQEEQQEQPLSYVDWEWARTIVVLREYRELLLQAFATYCEDEEEDEEDDEDEEEDEVEDGVGGFSTTPNNQHRTRSPRTSSRAAGQNFRASSTSKLFNRPGTSLPTSFFGSVSSSTSMTASRQLYRRSGGSTTVNAVTNKPAQPLTPLFVPISIAMQMTVPQLWKVIIDSKFVTHKFDATLINQLLQQRHYTVVGRSQGRSTSSQDGMRNKEGCEEVDAAEGKGQTEGAPVPPVMSSSSRSRIAPHRKRNVAKKGKPGAANARHTGAAVQAAEMAREAKLNGALAPLSFPEFVCAMLRLTDERYRPKAPRRQEEEEEPLDIEDEGATQEKGKEPKKSAAQRKAEHEEYLANIMPMLPTFSMRARFSFEMHFVEALGEQQQQRQQRREERERGLQRQQGQRSRQQPELRTGTSSARSGTPLAPVGRTTSSSRSSRGSSVTNVCCMDAAPQAVMDLDSDEVQFILHQHEHRLRAIFNAFAVADRGSIGGADCREGGKGGESSSAKHSPHHALMDIREFLYMLRELDLVAMSEADEPDFAQNFSASGEGEHWGSSIYDASVLTLDEGCRIFVAVNGFIGDPDADRFDYTAFTKALAHCCQLLSYDGIVPFPRRLDNFIKHGLLPRAVQRAGITALW
jgi:hypothetical protein